MRNISFVLSTLLFTGHLFALTKQEFCRQKTDFTHFKTSLLKVENRMAMRNQGGLFNGGVCWWHSRFQRNTHYLGLFQPQFNKLSKRSTKKLIRKIVKGKSVIKIPGFANLKELSSDPYFERYILRQLDKWQLRDGVFKFAWVNGLSGKHITSHEDLRFQLDKIHTEVMLEYIPYVKLQIKGISSHAWLIWDIKRVGRSYHISYIDSNRPTQTKFYKVKDGDRQIKFSRTSFVPRIF